MIKLISPVLEFLELIKNKQKRLKDIYLNRSKPLLTGEIGTLMGFTFKESKYEMLEIKSIEGPDVHGPNRYRVLNPAKNNSEQLDSSQKYFGFTYQNILLDGELVNVHHVSHIRLPTYPEELIIVVRSHKVRKLQCKDIPDIPILEFLAKQERPDSPGQYRWSTHGKGYSMPTVNDAMPMVTEANWKLAPAKMNQLIRRKLVHGGRRFHGRNDYTISELGLQYLADNLSL